MLHKSERLILIKSKKFRCLMDNSQKLEASCKKLQNDIGLLEKRINLTDAGEKGTLLKDKSNLNNNTLEIKQLRMQVEDLQVRLKRQQLSELSLLSEALKGKWKGSDPRGKSAKEIFQMVESHVFNLRNRSSSLSQNLRFLECTLNEKNKSLKEMTECCKELNATTEADALKQIKNLQNEHVKVIKNIKEEEDTGNMMKYLLENLKEKSFNQYELLMNLKKEISDMDKNTELQKEEGRKALNEKVMTLKSLEEDVSLIREATGMYDMKNIDYWLLEQKQLREILSEMIKKLEKRVVDLKVEKQEIKSKKVAVKEAGSLYPNREEEVSWAKRCLSEQKMRCDSAGSDLRKINSISTAVRSSLENILAALPMDSNTKESKNGEDSICDLAKHLEKAVLRAFPRSANNSAPGAGK